MGTARRPGDHPRLDDLVTRQSPWRSSLPTMAMPQLSRLPRVGRFVLFVLTLASHPTPQTAWGERLTAVTPPGRGHHVLVHDSFRGRTVMFGGLADASGNERNDTWEWDGSAWTRVLPAHSPPARSAAMACFDVRRRVVLLFGGELRGNPPTYFSDTWEWDGIDWRQLATSGPSPRSYAGLAFDHANGVPLLFGGRDGNSEMNDMWRLVSGGWQPITTIGPPPSSDFVFCSDPGRREIVLSGRYQLPIGFATWVWNGTAWLQYAIPNGYMQFPSPAAAYDAVRRRIVVVYDPIRQGGLNRTVGTIEWDGTTWIPRSPGQSPYVQWGTRLAFDTVTGRVLLFGGAHEDSFIVHTWEYFLLTSARYESYGLGCPGSTLTVPMLVPLDGELPWVGEDWNLEVRELPPAPHNFAFGLIGRSRTSFLGQPLPFDLGIIGMPGCQLLMSGDELTASLSNVSGRAPWTVRFPLDLRLIGTHYYLQAAVLDPTVNPLGVIVSNGGQAFIGMK